MCHEGPKIMCIQLRFPALPFIHKGFSWFPVLFFLFFIYLFIYFMHHNLCSHSLRNIILKLLNYLLLCFCQSGEPQPVLCHKGLSLSWMLLLCPSVFASPVQDVKCSILRHFWIELHKVLKNIFSLEFPCKFDTLFLGVLNFDVTRLDKY